MSVINWDNQLVINYSLETIATNLKSERLKRKCIGFQKLPRRLVNNIYNWQSAREFQSWLLLRYSSESMILAG